MKKVILLIAVILQVISGASAQVTPTTYGKDEYVDAPVVPMDVALKGRQGVTDYLMFQVERVSIGYSGRSFVNTGVNNHHFGLQWLKDLGYVHRGQFTELSDALSRIGFGAEVVPLPNGQYDISCSVYYYTADGKRALSGSGWLDIQRDPSGDLTAGTFRPWMSINGNILLQPTNDIRSAKWLGPQREEKYLSVYYEEGQNDPRILIPVNLLERGYLIVSDYYGNVTGWNLSNGQVIRGKYLLGLLGQTGSSDIKSIPNPGTINAQTLGIENIQFYKSEGQVYGRFPLFDVVTDQVIKEGFFFEVSVWGATNKIAPSKVFVTAVYLAPGWTGLNIGTEYELPFDTTHGGFQINIPPGGYHIRCQFDDLLDWESDPNPKG